MVDINREQFLGMEQQAKNELLFDNVCGTEEALRELSSKMDLLLKSPWRMAIPPVSWKAIGVFLVIMALIISGDVDRAFKVIALLFGG
jgi:hypothetical protein